MEVGADKAFRKGGRIAPAAFVGARALHHHDRAVAQELPALPTDLLLVKGHARPTGRKRVAVLFSGGPASGGHDTLCGIADALKGHALLGVHGGPGGLLTGALKPLSTKGLRGTGGFHALGTDRTKLKPHLEQIRTICAQHGIDAIIIIGGDDSNTNAAFLANALHGVQVIGVPKTMDCDLQALPWIPCTFGFDTACRTYAELVGNLIADTLSTRRYWHVVRLMGRDASHVTLEVALRTHPTLTLISEEEGWRQRTLHDVVEEVAALVNERVAAGKDYGVILVPEGLLERLADVRGLVHDIDLLWARKGSALGRRQLSRRRAYVARKLAYHRDLFLRFPARFQEMLCLDRDAHGNIKLSQLPTEELLTELVRARVERDGYVFRAVNHFYGYEGRCGAPSTFDQWLGYNLGLVAGSLVADGRTGYLSAFGDLSRGGRPAAVPLAALLDVEQRAGQAGLVIRKRLIQHDDPAFLAFARERSSWRRDAPLVRRPCDPGRILLPVTVALNEGKR